MAIYHCSLRIFSRSEGHSAVAAAAYRAGAVLKDQRTGRIHRYGKRKGVLDAFILAPPSTPQNLLDRAVLWNAAEEAETRKNSRVAREVILALPHELSDADRHTLCRDMAMWLVERYGVAVDTAIHSPVLGDGHDGRNHHSHLLFTTREITKDGFGKKTRILDDKEHGPQEVEIIREVWETLANDALARAGFEGVQIDRRTLEDQGVDRVPQTHVGKAANHAEEDEKPANRHKLKSHFADTDKHSETEDTDGEDESESKSGKTGKAGSGDRALILKSEAKEDRKGRIIDYKTIDQNRTRLDFNEEIKKLNERRNTFGNVPIKEQIAHIEKLTDLLESRQGHLKTLLSKATLPHAIKWAIETLITNFKEAVFVREKDRAVSKFTAEEKAARTERQLSRYSKPYRAGLQEQIVEMKTNLDRLEQRQREYQSLKNFVDKIENQVRQLSKISFEQSVKPQPIKAITNEEYSLKLNLKAQMIREFVPTEFKPDKQQSITKAQIDFKAEKAPDTSSRKYIRLPLEVPQPKTLNPQQPEHPVSFNSKSVANKSAPEKIFQPLTVKFQTKVTSPVASQKIEPKTSEWKQPMPVRILAMEKALKERLQQSNIAPKTTTEPSERKSWFTPATEKTQPLQKSIYKEMAGIKKPEAETSPIKEQFSKLPVPAIPVVKTTNKIEIEKVKQEAQEIRKKVPPQYKVEPYEIPPEQEITDEQKEKLFKYEFSAKAEDRTPVTGATHQNPAAKTETPKLKMSYQFNDVSSHTEEAQELMMEFGEKLIPVT